MDPIDIIRQAKRPKRTVKLCLRLDLADEYEKLDDELARLAPSSDSLTGTTPEAAAIAARMAELRDTMEAHSIAVEFEALGTRAYNELVERHPPRHGEDGKPLPADAAIGYNPRAMFPALIEACWRSPELPEAVRRELLDDTLTDRQYDQLMSAVVDVNRSTVDIPFSSAASAIRTRSAAG